MGLLAVIAACRSAPRNPRREVSSRIETVRAALRDGELERAEEQLAYARQRFPDNGAVRLWSAKLAAMRWHTGEALEHLRAVVGAEDRGSWTQAEVEGEIGDLLFRAGRWRESVPHLEAGQVGPMGAARGAWAQLARDLPSVRDQPRLDFAELPLVGDGLPRLVCAIGSKERVFAVDTGATFTTLSNTMATELDVSPVIAAGTGTDGTGRLFPTAVGILNSFSFGDVQVGHHPVLVVEDARLQLREGGASGPHAVIGLDVITRFRAIYDPQRRSITFQTSKGLASPESVPCVWVDDRLLVAVVVEDRQLWFALDTGASRSSLTDRGLTRLPGGARRAHETYWRVHTPGGVRVAVQVVRGLLLEVSDVRLPGVDLPVVEREPSAFFPLDGVLGADLLLRCRVTLDAGRVRIEAV
ncbi:MAG: pepsin/retropepsin-like aspartic protease family protein [Planctomycetota bacterium]